MEDGRWHLCAEIEQGRASSSFGRESDLAEAAAELLAAQRLAGPLSATTPDRKTQVLADERTSYDNLTFGAVPTKGDPKTERMTSHNGTTATYQVTGTKAYDAFGRPLSQKSAKQQGTTEETKTAYTETNGLLTKTTVTNAVGHVTTTDYEPAWGMSKGQTDPNGKRTDLAYDALGRLTSVWLADRTSPQTPSIKYSYNVRKDKVTSIKTEKIEDDGSYGAEYQLYAALLRPRQIQTEGLDGTRMVADTWYDGTGNVRKTNATYNAAGAPSDELLIVANGEVGQQSLMEYDGLGRPTAQIFAVGGSEQWRTTTTYEGEPTHVDPPVGGVPTTTITDGQGNVAEIRHYRGASLAAGVPYDSTKYTYTAAGQLETVTDAKGNVWRYESRGVRPVGNGMRSRARRAVWRDRPAASIASKRDPARPANSLTTALTCLVRRAVRRW